MKNKLKKTDENGKKKIWTIYTRLSHIILITLVTTAYIIIESENNIINHVLVGYVIAIIILFRILWGFMGVKCSQHGDLVRKLPEIPKYFQNLLLVNKDNYKGHNPAASLYIFLIMTTLMFVTISGSVLYGIQENSGIFASLNSTYSDWMIVVESLHKNSTTLLLVFISIHIIGVVLNLILHGKDAILSMVTGKKYGTDFDVTLNVKQELFGIVWIGTTIFSIIYFYNNPDNILTENQEVEINFREASYETQSSCGSCHMVYPAYLLPKQSWNNMMDNLENHYGKDASLPEEEAKIVRDYLINNAAENSTREAAVKVLHNLKTDVPKDITSSTYWKNTHAHITKEEFEADYGIKSDCRTCHKTIRDGMIQDTKIKFHF